MLRDDAAPERPAWQESLFPVRAAEGSPEPTPQPGRRARVFELGATIEQSTWDPYRRSPAGSAFDPFKAGAITGVIFDETERDLDKAIDYVVLFRFPDTPAMERSWQRRAKAAAADAPEREGPCFDGDAGRGSWPHGEYLCYVSDSGPALRRWTDERTDTYGVMNGVAGKKRLGLLARRWEAIRSR